MKRYFLVTSLLLFTYSITAQNHIKDCNYGECATMLNALPKEYRKHNQTDSSVIISIGNPDYYVYIFSKKKILYIKYPYYRYKSKKGRIVVKYKVEVLYKPDFSFSALYDKASCNFDTEILADDTGNMILQFVFGRKNYCRCFEQVAGEYFMFRNSSFEFIVSKMYPPAPR